MNDDLRFDSYLTARASGLDLPPGNIGSVLDRVAQRRRHRRAAVSACTAIAVLGGALTVVNVGGSDTPEHVVARAGGADLVKSPLEWTAVNPRSGLSFSSARTTGPDNALYSLSTAPGSVGDDGSTAVLYRSTDGIEWTPTSLPDGLHPSSIASAGQSLYAVGTAPAGGRADLVQLASSSTAGATWSKIDVPLDLEALESRYGVQVAVNGLQVASNGTNTVVAVGVGLRDDVRRFVPGGVADDQWPSVDKTGITVYAPPTEAGEAAKIRAKEAPVVLATYTWEQLGIDDVLRSLILGETRMYVSDQGAPFSPAAVMSVLSSGPLFTSADGFRMVVSTADQRSTSMLLTSVDGRTWQADPLATSSGWLLSAGVRRDMVALVTSAETTTGQTGLIRMQQPGGTWAEIDLVDVLHRAGVTGDYNVATAGVGPLGVAAVMHESTDRDDAHRYLVTTTDGNDVSVIDLDELVGDGYPGEVHVSADAITVTVHAPGKAGTDGPVRLLVGTPPR